MISHISEYDYPHPANAETARQAKLRRLTHLPLNLSPHNQETEDVHAQSQQP